MDLYIENYSQKTIKALSVFPIYKMRVQTLICPVAAALHSGLFPLMWSLKLAFFFFFCSDGFLPVWRLNVAAFDGRLHSLALTESDVKDH